MYSSLSIREGPCKLYVGLSEIGCDVAGLFLTLFDRLISRAASWPAHYKQR